MKVVTRKQVGSIIDDYSIKLVPMTTIGQQYGITRQAIHKILRKHGIDTSKRKIEVTCCACGSVIMRNKCTIRNRKRVFCGEACYHAYLGAISDYQPWRQGGRIARKRVSEVFELLEGHVVHHVDGNNYNNYLNNLMVFKNQGDHIRYHRGLEADPIYIGH